MHPGLISLLCYALLLSATLHHMDDDCSHYQITVIRKLQNLLIHQEWLNLSDWLEGRASLKDL